ncbi:MAG: hypothetical protein ACK5HS_01310 [Mycoplasmatales bacterium]
MIRKVILVIFMIFVAIFAYKDDAYKKEQIKLKAAYLEDYESNRDNLLDFFQKNVSENDFTVLVKPELDKIKQYNQKQYDLDYKELDSTKSLLQDIKDGIRKNIDKEFSTLQEEKDEQFNIKLDYTSSQKRKLKNYKNTFKNLKIEDKSLVSYYFNYKKYEKEVSSLTKFVKDANASIQYEIDENNKLYRKYCYQMAGIESGWRELRPGNYHGVVGVDFPWRGYADSYEWCWDKARAIPQTSSAYYNYTCNVYKSMKLCDKSYWAEFWNDVQNTNLN